MREYSALLFFQSRFVRVDFLFWCRVRKGQTLMIPILALNRDKSIWGQDALEFRSVFSAPFVFLSVYLCEWATDLPLTQARTMGIHSRSRK